MVKNQVARAFQSASNNSANNSKQEKETGIPLFTTYHPRFIDLSSLIKKNLQYLYAGQQVKRKSLHLHHLFFSGVPEIYKVSVGSEKFNEKLCLVCLNVPETDTFESFQTKKQYKINHNSYCNDKCLIYFLSCKICGLQYVGSTTDPFRYRWDNYKDNNGKAERGVEHVQTDLLEHFVSHGHNGFLEDCTITLIDKNDGPDPTRREECRYIISVLSLYNF